MCYQTRKPSIPENLKEKQVHFVNCVRYQQQDDDTRKVKIRRDADGNKTVNQYVLLKKIGRGAYAKVKLCLNTEDNQYYVSMRFRLVFVVMNCSSREMQFITMKPLKIKASYVFDRQ